MEEKIKNSDSLIKMKGAEGKEMTVLYYGPIAPAGKPSIGGFESANRKNIDKLRELGVKVVEFPNPVVNHKYDPIGKLVYFKSFFTALAVLRHAASKNVVVHCTPLYGNSIILPALWLFRLAKFCGIKRVADIRAGSFINIFKSHSDRCRRQMRNILKLADVVTVEGSSYIRDIKEVLGVNRPTYYFPNLAICKALKYHERQTKEINLFYFGRITKNKGIDVLLDMMDYLGDEYRLYIAGNIAKDIDGNSLVKKNVTYLGSLAPQDLKEQMKTMHYFVFPTRHSGEGQSNSLIEAMSFGLVPITADQGFCREVVADCGVVLPQGASGKDYAECLKSISSEQWEGLSRKCVEHVVKCHNVDVEIPKLVDIYENLLNER